MSLLLLLYTSFKHTHTTEWVWRSKDSLRNSVPTFRHRFWGSNSGCQAFAVSPFTHSAVLLAVEDDYEYISGSHLRIHQFSRQGPPRTPRWLTLSLLPIAHGVNPLGCQHQIQGQLLPRALILPKPSLSWGSAQDIPAFHALFATTLGTGVRIYLNVISEGILRFMILKETRLNNILKAVE